MNSSARPAWQVWPAIAGWTILAITLSGAAFTSSSEAASFDCRKASSVVERLICANSQVSALDARLDHEYKSALANARDQNQLRDSQRWWLKNIRDTCKTVDCLAQVYEERLLALPEPWMLTQAPPPASTALTSKEAHACHLVAEASNLGRLDAYVQRPDLTQPTRSRLVQIFGPDNVIVGSEEYWHIDLDGDGESDHFIISTQGTAALASAIGRLSRPGSMPAAVDDNGNSSVDLSLLKIDGSYYLVSHTDGPEKLWSWRQNGMLERLCTFDHREPKITLTPESRHPVCAAITQGDTKPIEYRLTHKMDYLRDKRLFDQVRVVEGLAMVDLNNDGHLDPVVRLEMAHGAGRGCDTEYLAITDSTHTGIPDSKLNHLLLSEIGDFACGPKMSALTFQGNIFLDAAERNGDRAIYLISGDSAEKVCTWKYQAMREVLN